MYYKAFKEVHFIDDETKFFLFKSSSLVRFFKFAVSPFSKFNNVGCRHDVDFQFSPI